MDTHGPKLIWRPNILAIGFKSKMLLRVFKVVFFHSLCLWGQRPYELIIVKYVDGEPPACWPALMTKIRAGRIRLLPSPIKVVAINNAPMAVSDKDTVVYVSPQEIDETEPERLRDFCMQQMIEQMLTDPRASLVIAR
ncbi:MAG: hypothetical protein WCG99_02995 [Candidatus Berkelbacteria bacterium]